MSCAAELNCEDACRCVRCGGHQLHVAMPILGPGMWPTGRCKLCTERWSAAVEQEKRSRVAREEAERRARSEAPAAAKVAPMKKAFSGGFGG